MFDFTRMIITVAGVGLGWAIACAHEPPVAGNDLGLSEELRGLLLDEMREITAASQTLVLATASGDWRAIIETSERIAASYVMAKNLTEAQKQELREKLPDGFKRLDSEFHARAVKLAMAAASRDPETVAFQYSRLLESCAVCHAAYAGSRFPGFASKTSAVPEHHD